MQDSFFFDVARTDADLRQILALQEANHVAALTAESRATNGFVTVKHDLGLLKRMNEAAPQVIAKSGERVVGYALVMLPTFAEQVPVLLPMFELLKRLTFAGAPLSDRAYYVMGQICIDEEFRGQGVFEGLYARHLETLANRFDCCITEISVNNPRSLRAHEKVGFQVIHTFADATDTWKVVLWNWKEGVK